jgi:hypothetical protein
MIMKKTDNASQYRKLQDRVPQDHELDVVAGGFALLGFTSGTSIQEVGEALSTIAKKG